MFPVCFLRFFSFFMFFLAFLFIFSERFFTFGQAKGNARYGRSRHQPKFSSL